MIGKRVEIPPHYDLWMRGARYGTYMGLNRHMSRVRGFAIGRVRMDHPQVKKLVNIPIDELKVL
jgi:hypothetical protein